ncbi:MAG: periplasmic heavy metal sensor [Deltaproteobacteria bacterium]|nr:periplasmic heavy metal sensor [Deltaproteobacteria bacterium]
MKKSNKVIVGALLLSGILAAAQVEAQVGPGRGRGMHHGRMFENLNLTDSQKKTIGDMMASNRESMRPLMQRLREQRQRLNEAGQRQPFDEAGVRSQAQELAKLQSEMMVHRAAMMNRISTVLTPEQRAKWQEQRAQRKAQFKDGMGRQRGRRGGQAS